MDTAQLRTALALLDNSTVNRTAAALGVAASSVSDRVRKLETELGRPLFVRDRVGMHPTSAGRAYLHAAGAALDVLDAAAEQLRAAAGVVVGAQASIADELLPAVLDGLDRRHPDLVVEVRPDPDRARLLRDLDRGGLDAVVLLDTGSDLGGLGFTVPDDRLEHLDVRDVAMAVVARPDHALVGRTVSMDDIRRSGDLVGREPRCSFWMATRRWLGPDVELTSVGGLAQVRDWVAAGRGIALLPVFAVRSDLDSDRVVPIDVPAPPLQLRLVWRRDPEQSSSLRALLYALSQT